VFLEELELVLFQEELDLGAVAEFLAQGVAAHGEGAHTSAGNHVTF